MKKIIVSLMSLCAVSVVSAQTTGELLKFSQYDFGSATARSSAMAGAFTSLGADLSSMSINPAGLAMYSSSEAAISLGGNIGAVRSNYGGYNENMSSEFNVTLPNFAAAFTHDNFTFAVGFNQLANFNSYMTTEGNYEQFNSSARMWVDQLTFVSQETLNKPSLAFDMKPVMWNAAMAYESYVIDPAYDGADWYGLWDVIDPWDYIASVVTMQTSGSLNEGVLSGAYNLNNKLYFGLSLGLQSLYYQQSSTMSEYTDLETAVGVFNDMHTRNWMTIDGWGFNIKAGVTVRPAPWVRIGVAYHSPTWYTIKEISNSDMTAYFEGSEKPFYDSYTPDLIQDYFMQSPERLLAGASFTLGRIGILSVDYERTSYKTMRYNSNLSTSGWRPGILSNDIDNIPNFASYMDDRGNLEINNMISDSYAATNNYRVGLEVTPFPSFFMRLGYAYSDSPYASTRSTYANTVRSDYGAISKYCGGLGYRTGRFNLDVSYAYSTWSSLPNKYFDYITSYTYNTGYKIDGAEYIIDAGTNIASFDNINQQNFNHNIIVTASWRF